MPNENGSKIKNHRKKAAIRPVKVPDKLKDSLFDESWRRSWKAPRIKLLLKNPTTLFAYWELADWQRNLVSRHFQSEWKELPFLLNVYDVTSLLFDGYNAHTTQTIAVSPDSESWYIHNVTPGRVYIVSFGTTTLANHFFSILQSNSVQTPLLHKQHHFAGENGPHPIVTFTRPFWRRMTEDQPILPVVDDFISPTVHHSVYKGYKLDYRWEYDNPGEVGSGQGLFPEGKGGQSHG